MISSGVMLSLAFVAAIVMMTSLFTHPVSVNAHAIVIDSIPADGATLTQPPMQVLLRFDAKIIHSLAVVSLISADGRKIALPAAGDNHAAAAFPDRLVIPLPHLRRGAYILRYKVLAKDGHATLGILRFSIK